MTTLVWRREHKKKRLQKIKSVAIIMLHVKNRWPTNIDSFCFVNYYNIAGRKLMGISIPFFIKKGSLFKKMVKVNKNLTIEI